MKILPVQILILLLALTAITCWHYYFTRPDVPQAREERQTTSSAVKREPPSPTVRILTDPETERPTPSVHGAEDLLAKHPQMLVALRQRWDEEGIRTLGTDPSRLNHAEVRNASLPSLILTGKQLEGTSFVNCDLGGLTLEDVVLTSVTFRQTHLRHARFNNVTFSNCRFENAGLEKAVLENCRFLGGSLAQVEIPGEDRAPAAFKECLMQDVTFSAFAFDRTSLQQITGRLIFKNITELRKDPDWSVLAGKNLELIMEDCRISDPKARLTFANITGNYRIYARNCLFSNSELHINGYNDGSPPGDLKRVIQMDNCALENEAFLHTDGLALIRQSAISGHSSLSGTDRSLWWLEGCSFSSEGGQAVHLYGDAGTSMYIRGTGPDNPPDNPPARLIIYNEGKTSLRDLTLENPVFGRRGTRLRELNLLRVRLEGGDLSGLRLLAGQWEDVTVLPEMTVTDNTTLGAIRVKNLRFPQERPWRGLDREKRELDLPPDTPSLLWDEPAAPDLSADILGAQSLR